MEQPTSEGEVRPTEQVDDQPKELDVVSLWSKRIKKAEDKLEPYWKEEGRLFEYWWMWMRRRGPFLNNYVPPEAHSHVESVTSKITRTRPELRVLARNQQSAGREPKVGELDRYAWQEMGMDNIYTRFVKRGLWMGLAVEKLTWRTETTEIEEEVPVYAKDEMGAPVLDEQGQPVQIGTEIQKRVVPIYDAPQPELIDNTDFIYPLGYDSIEALPWGDHRITKWRSEIDEELYEPEDLKKLDKEHGNSTPTDYKADRYRVMEFPEPLSAQEDENPAVVNLAQMNDSEGGNMENDYKLEMHELWIRKSPKYPKGKRYTIVNGKFLLRRKNGLDDNPTPDGDLPFVAWSPVDDTFHLRGMGLVREMEKAFLYKKKQRDQRLDNVDISIHGMWKVQSNEDLDDDELMAFPNNVIRLSNLANAQRVEMRDTTAPSVREESINDQDIQKATGTNDYSAGVSPDEKRTATEIDTLVTSANERYDGIIRSLNRALGRHGKLVLKLFQQNWDAPQLARLIGEDGAVSFLQLDPLEFQGDFEFQYDVAPALATNSVVRSQGMELLSIISKIPGTNIRPVVLKVIKSFKDLNISPDEVYPEPPAIDPAVPPATPPEGLPAPGSTNPTNASEMAQTQTL